VESLDTETRLHTLNGEVYRSRTPISQWQQILEDGFLRTHRSFLVNTNHIKSASEDEVILGETTIPISRKYKSQALFKLNN
jgi:DNA-binding LytR/AlgR family response regulator